MVLQKSTAKISIYMEGIAAYLASYRAREVLTQNEMALKLGLSLNRYREYEQNTTDNSKGIALDLLLKIAELENIAPAEFLQKLDDSKLEGSSDLDDFENILVAEFRNVSLDDRRNFIAMVREGIPEETLVPNKMRWAIKIINMLGGLPYDQRMKFEREILEEFIAFKKPIPGSHEHEHLLDRLRELVKHYFTHFDGYRR